MQKINLKKILPHVIAIALFAIIALVYCKPVLSGKVLQQHDVTQWKAMAQQSLQYEKTHGHFPLWTNSMFSGMPGYQIAYGVDNPISVGYINNVLSLGLPTICSYFFMACVCFYILALVFGANIWVAFFTALGYAYATYNPIIVAEGHNTKMMAISYLPGFIAGWALLFKKKYVTGAAVLSFFTAMLVSSSHHQITYYAFMIAGFMGVAYTVSFIIKKQIKHLGIAAVIGIISVILGIAISATTIATTNEYAKYSIRGGSILAGDKDYKGKVGKDGLSKEYAFSYSMYKTEPLVLMFPHLYGGSNKMEVAEESSKAVEALREMQPQIAQQLQGYMSFYWGGIGGTSGPPYVGAIICFLAILGFITIHSKHKWWTLSLTILALMLSWGQFFEGFNLWVFEHLPMYNKFRAPSMIMVIPTFIICFLAIFGLNNILSTNNKEEFFNKYKKAIYAVASLVAVAVVFYIMSDYKSDNDINLLKQINEIPDATQKEAFLTAAKSLLNALKEDRKSLLLGSIIRSLVFISIAAVALWAFLKNKINEVVAVSVVGIAAFIDVMLINSKYLNSDNYVDAEEYDNHFVASPASQQILKDKSNYRVFDLSNGVQQAFNYGAPLSYFHNSIGGYHAAKLSLYQDLIENQLYNFPNCWPVVNMLNTKYLVQRNPQSGALEAQTNPDALGSCWFVKDVVAKKSPREVMNALTNFNPKDTAFVEEAEKTLVKYTANATNDTLDKISLVKNDNDIVEYSSSSKSDRFAVFSEVYYKAGWKAYIDGKEQPIVKTNYVLRGLSIPAGEHRINFEFKPDSYYKMTKLAIIASAIIWLLVISAVVVGIKRKQLV